MNLNKWWILVHYNFDHYWSANFLSLPVRAPSSWLLCLFDTVVFDDFIAKTRFSSCIIPPHTWNQSLGISPRSLNLFLWNLFHSFGPTDIHSYWISQCFLVHLINKMRKTFVCLFLCIHIGMYTYIYIYIYI